MISLSNFPLTFIFSLEPGNKCDEECVTQPDKCKFYVPDKWNTPITAEQREIEGECLHFCTCACICVYITDHLCYFTEFVCVAEPIFDECPSSNFVSGLFKNNSNCPYCDKHPHCGCSCSSYIVA